MVFAPEPEPLPLNPTPELPKDKIVERGVEAYDRFFDQRKQLHDETSKTIRRVIYTLVGTCLFCIITLAGTSDVDLLKAGATVELPVLNYDMQFPAFLIVGPVVLIALNLYLQIFMGQHRRYSVAAESRLPMLPNFDSWTARITVGLICYWMVPVTLGLFAWKGWPRPLGPVLLYVAIAIAVVMVALQVRRSPRHWRLATVPVLIVSLLIFSVGLDEILQTRRLNLFKADLAAQDLRGTNLSGADLREANLTEANLTEADLTEADLSGANLTEANLTEADLTEADLSGANLRGANLFFANLTEANLSRADLTEAELLAANLTEANLRGAFLNGADLVEAELRGANLSGADLTGAFLTGAELRGANLSGADLTGAFLTGAFLTGADLGDARFCRTIMLDGTLDDSGCE